MLWGLEPSGSFSVKSIYAKLASEPKIGYPKALSEARVLMTHKCRGSIIVLLISKSVEHNEEQKEMTSGF